jgi:hypothetical protein
LKKGDRVLGLSASALRNDHRFGTHQRFTLLTELLTTHVSNWPRHYIPNSNRWNELADEMTIAKIGDAPFAEASSASSVYSAMSALILHLKLDRPSTNAKPKSETILIWGGASTIGFYAIQIASQAGYKVITTASPTNAQSLKHAGAVEVFDYHSPAVFDNLLAFGPYEAIFGASEMAADQVVIGKLLAAHGGGEFLTTMGLRPGVVLPDGVRGYRVQYMDDYLKPENKEYVEWVFWEYLQDGLVNRTLKLGNVEVVGGLGKLQESLGRLEAGEVRGKKLVITPHLD